MKIDQIVLNDIRSVVVYARDNEPAFVREVEQVIRKAEAGSTHDAEIELAKATSRIAEIDRIINGLYEDKIRGLLTSERFASMMTNYETEQKALRERATELRTSRDKQKEDAEAAKQFISLVKRYTDATELTPEMISGLISKIIVGRFSKEHQDITIEYRVIGKREPMR